MKGIVHIPAKEADTNTAGYLSAADKKKLDGIAESANNYTHPKSAAGAKTAGLYKITTDKEGHVTGATAIKKTDITTLGIPGSDTVYTHPTSAAGAKAEGLYKITTDAAGHVTGAVEVTKEDITALGIPGGEDEGYVHPKSPIGAKPSGLYKIATDDTGHVVEAEEVADATTKEHGLMSVDDKKKLDDVSEGSHIVTADGYLHDDRLILGAYESSGELHKVKTSSRTIRDVVLGGNKITDYNKIIVAGTADQFVTQSSLDADTVVFTEDTLNNDHILVGQKPPRSNIKTKIADSGVAIGNVVTTTETHTANDIAAFKDAETKELIPTGISINDLVDMFFITRDPKMSALFPNSKSDIFFVKYGSSDRPAQVAIKKSSGLRYVNKSYFYGAQVYSDFESTLKTHSSFDGSTPSLASGIYNVNGEDYYLITMTANRVWYWDTTDATIHIVIWNDWFINKPKNYIKCVPLLISGTDGTSTPLNSNLNNGSIPVTADPRTSAHDGALFRSSYLIGGTLYDYAMVNEPVTGWSDGTWKAFE